MKKKALILAAGKGTRLVSEREFPKPLMKVQELPLLVHILRRLEAAGIEDVGIIVGYLGQQIIDALEAYTFSFPIQFIWNDEYEKPNGTSLLKAKNYVDGPTFLMMSDHLWEAELLEAVASFPMKPDESVLGIDLKIDRCFDIDDATKVCFEGTEIKNIGKELPSYDALDTGVFWITPALMDALVEAETEQGCSLSQGVASMAARGKMHVADVGHAMWIDVDTPEAHAQAELLLEKYGPYLQPKS